MVPQAAKIGARNSLILGISLMSHWCFYWKLASVSLYIICSMWMRCISVSPCNSKENMMTSSNGHIFRVTGHLCREFTGNRWIPRTMASDVELWCFLWSAPLINWANNREAGDLRRHRAHFDVIVMNKMHEIREWTFHGFYYTIYV